MSHISLLLNHVTELSTDLWKLLRMVELPENASQMFAMSVFRKNPVCYIVLMVITTFNSDGRCMVPILIILSFGPDLDMAVLKCK